MKIPEFEQLESLKRQRKELDYQLKTDRITPREHERAMKRLDGEQKALAFPASESLRKTEKALKAMYQRNRDALRGEANMQAGKTDYARLDEARRYIARKMGDVRTWKDAEDFMRSVRETGDETMLRAAIETVLDRPTETDAEGMRGIMLKQQLRPELEKYILSPKQIELQEQRKQIDQAIADYAAQIGEARKEFETHPTSEQILTNNKPPDYFAGIGQGIHLEVLPDQSDPLTMQLRVDLDESWDGPTGEYTGAPEGLKPVFTGEEEPDPRWDGFRYRRE